jgi:hypothetical protein
MSRLRVGSLSNPFAKTGESSGSIKGPMRPSVDRSQSALLPLGNMGAEQSSEEDTPATGRAPAGQSSASKTMTGAGKRNRAHTVSVAFGSGRRGSGMRDGARRDSASTNPRSLEEGLGRERTRSPVGFELGDEQEDLHDEVVGMLDCIDPEVSTGEYPGMTTKPCQAK